MRCFTCVRKFTLSWVEYYTNRIFTGSSSTVAASLNISPSHSRLFEIVFFSRAYKYLLVFHFNYVCISYHFWDISHQIGVTLKSEPWVFKVIEYGTIQELVYVSYSNSIVITMAASCYSCIISEIKWDIGQNRDFSYPRRDALVKGEGSRLNISITFGIEKLELRA